MIKKQTYAFINIYNIHIFCCLLYNKFNLILSVALKRITLNVVTILFLVYLVLLEVINPKLLLSYSLLYRNPRWNALIWTICRFLRFFFFLFLNRIFPFSEKKCEIQGSRKTSTGTWRNNWLTIPAKSTDSFLFNCGSITFKTSCPFSRRNRLVASAVIIVKFVQIILLVIGC